MAVTDADGIIYYRYIYDTYGELSDITTDDGVSLKSFEQLTEYRLSELAHATGIDYLYNGQYGVETDQNGLYYMRARYYDQDIKRFINRDVVSGDISNSQSLNRYCYVQGNPVSLTDPFGLCPDPNSNFKNFCKVLYYTDWNAVGHAALDMAGVFWEGADVLNAAWYLAEGNTEMAISSMLYAVPGFGMGIGNLMMKGAKFAPYGRIVSAVSRMTQSGMGIGAGINMAQIGFTNMLHGAESGELNAEDVAMFIGGIAISTLSGKNLVPSTKSLMTISDGAGKTSKVGKGYLTDSDVNSMPMIGRGNNSDDIYAGVKEASAYLKQQGVPRKYRKQILESFDVRTIKLQTAGESTYGLRFFGGKAEKKGRYLFETFSPLTNRNNLALPYEWNNMTGVQQFKVRNGTKMITGNAAPQTSFGEQYVGGAYQWYINNLEDLIECQ